MKLSCNHDGVSELFDENKQDIVLNIYFGRRYGGGWASLLAQRACQVALVVKNPPVDSGDTRDTGSIPGSFFATGPPGKSLAFPDLALCCTGWSPSSYRSSFGDGAPVRSSESISPHVLVSMSTCTSQNPKVSAVYSGYRITCLD